MGGNSASLGPLPSSGSADASPAGSVGPESSAGGSEGPSSGAATSSEPFSGSGSSLGCSSPAPASSPSGEFSGGSPLASAGTSSESTSDTNVSVWTLLS